MKLDKARKELFDEIIKQSFYIVLMAAFLTSCRKQVPEKIIPLNSDYDNMVRNYLSFTVPTITVDELLNKKDYLLIDCRKPEEYETSTINGAINIPNKKIADNMLKKYSKETQIIVFCSIGYRSEKMAKALIKKGYKNTNNLYGSIFEWANRGLPLYHETKLTDTIHTYNDKWSKWITNNQLTKIW